MGNKEIAAVTACIGSRKQEWRRPVGEVVQAEYLMKCFSQKLRLICKASNGKAHSASDSIMQEVLTIRNHSRKLKMTKSSLHVHLNVP